MGTQPSRYRAGCGSSQKSLQGYEDRGDLWPYLVHLRWAEAEKKLGVCQQPGGVQRNSPLPCRLEVVVVMVGCWSCGFRRCLLDHLSRVLQPDAFVVWMRMLLMGEMLPQWINGLVARFFVFKRAGMKLLMVGRRDPAP